MNSILVPTDFSQEAKSAYQLALQLSSKIGARVTLLHVADLPVSSDPMGTNLHTLFSNDLIGQLETNLTDRLNSFKEEFSPSDMVDTKLIWGNPFKGISEAVSSIDADLIVMGTKGATGAHELFIGSNAEKVVRHSAIPVLSVKGDVKIAAIQNIVYGTDLSLDQDDLVNNVIALQQLFEAKLRIVRINTPANFKIDAVSDLEIESFIEKYQIENYSVNIYNDFHEDLGLMRFATKIGADMIAMGTHGRTGINHLFRSSIAEDVINHAKYPIWTYSIK